MKKAILTLAIALISAATYAQTTVTNIDTAGTVNIGDKGVTVVKPGKASKKHIAPEVISADTPRIYTVILHMDADGVAAITATPEQWMQVETSDKLNGAQISMFKGLAAAIRNEIWLQKQNQDKPIPLAPKKKK